MLRTHRRITPKLGGRGRVGKKDVRRLKPVFSVAGACIVPEPAPTIKTDSKRTDVPEEYIPIAVNVQEASPQPVRSGGFSIKSIVHTEKNVETGDSAEPQDNPALSPGTDNKVDFVDLVVAWKTFARNLPAEEIATAQRLEQIEPQLTGNYEFEVMAENPDIEGILHSFAQRILRSMRVQLGCPALKMTIRLRELSDKPRILSKREQLEEMKRINPALGMLVKEFDLTL